MFKLFRRAEPPAPPPRKKPPQARTEQTRSPSRAPVVQEPLPVPEVVEDHDESAWSQWEESQFQLDSQLGGLSARDSVKVRDGGGSKPGSDPDPFALIGKNHR